ncbi:hypothetical protein NUW58_g7299 [Xylaria curta]|uniref:Uncharacterized protein n=1 Tax=Xylaria curta TaxID=42375 RepID=A0ACC1NIB1_9PEZI|nr:hypothetical protein NUW58_g7299 [Xylaria curta]
MGPRRPLAPKPFLFAASSLGHSVQPNTRIVKQRRNHHTAEDWARKKDTIIRLYTTENLKAERVVEVLRSESFITRHVFNSAHFFITNRRHSRRQLFNKLNEWGIQKNKRRDDENPQDFPVGTEGEDDVMELDIIVPRMESPSLAFPLSNETPAYSLDNGEINGMMAAEGQPALGGTLSPLAQSRQSLGSCVDASPWVQHPYDEIPLESLDLGTPWHLQNEFSPASPGPARPSTAMTTQRWSPPLSNLGSVVESCNQSPSGIQDLTPASPCVLQGMTGLQDKQQREPTPEAHLLLEAMLSSIVGFATGKECIFKGNGTLKLKEDLSSLFNLTQSSLICPSSGHHTLGDEIRLINGLVSSAPAISINPTSSVRFPYNLLLGKRILWKLRQMRFNIGTGILDVTAKTPEEHSTETNCDEISFEDSMIHSSLKIRFINSSVALLIELNQCQLVDGAFSSIPGLSINNIVPNSSLIFQIAADGSVQDLKDLFASGNASIRDRDENGCSLLRYSLDKPQICQFLVENGFDVDEICYGPAREKNGTLRFTTLLRLSLRGGNLETFRILLAAGADPTIPSSRMCSVVNSISPRVEPKYYALLNHVLNLSAHYEVFDVRNGIGETIFLSVFSLDRPVGEYEPDPVKRIKLLLDRGSRVDEIDPRGSTCLHLFFRSRLKPPSKENWLDALIYTIRKGADVYAADGTGITVSQMAYAQSNCRDINYPGYDDKYSFGSYRGDLWDAALNASGYDILEFRKPHPRRARYTQKYTRQDFESLWQDRKHLCPYWDDAEWPATLEPDRAVTDLKNSQKYLCVCSSGPHVRWLEPHNKDTLCYSSPYYDTDAVSSSDTDSDIASDDSDDEDGGQEEREEREEREDEITISQGVPRISSTHDFYESSSADARAMQSLFEELDRLSDPNAPETQTG